MENPFEIINERLDRIEKLLQNIYATKDAKAKGVIIPEIMNVKEVANYLSITPSAIYKLTSTKEIPHSKRGKRLYFQKAEINDWIVKHKQYTNDDIERMASDYLIKNPLRFK
ncbi:helix-turn-helix domain-containing protein [Jejuia pallidilutea]|uniref:Putative excisionase n=1 Tax=Jejuia pallidilutea TaxID=504487 RepID=A0A090VMA6_9FLAO|nr:helix-turn-helix domain-containing protein [Jejuia pallidilutea]GAL65851.1 putative excisionase [Jejuia pallidilutea]GAL71480.1 putative excisionase [Jejuia pallidilutea]GAL88508.1 putative excisionase [Jejuia pallidilutea]